MNSSLLLREATTERIDRPNYPPPITQSTSSTGLLQPNLWLEFLRPIKRIIQLNAERHKSPVVSR
jgi:hypothetical protein